MRLSDYIAEEINRMLDESEQNIAEIQRNDFASKIGCVPSQINYVISSRFIPEHGYIVESRRGGGGYIRIKKVVLDKSSALMHLVNTVGHEIDDITARVVLDNCLRGSLLDQNAVNLMCAAVSTPVMREIPVHLRDSVRAAVLKQMLMSQL